MGKDIKFIAMFCLVVILFTSCASMKEAKSNKRDIIIRYAKNMLNKMYRYGKQDKHLGFDCSGLTQYAYREAGIKIPRTSKSQHAGAEEISKDEFRERTSFLTGKS